MEITHQLNANEL